MRTVVSIVLAACPLLAAPIPNLLNTGQQSSNGVDLSWLVDGAPAFVTEQTQFPFPNWAADANGVWISPQPSYGQVTDHRDHTFVFSTKFDLPDNFVSAFISMRAATDNALLDVKLNGNSVPVATTLRVLPGTTAAMGVIAEASGFRSGLGPPIQITSDFRPGENILELYVRNSATDESNARNPSGLMAAFESDVVYGPDDPVNGIPEPAGIALTAGGLMLLGAGAKQRR